MKSHLRRYTSLGDIHKADDDGCITNGRLEFHTNERVLYVDKEPVRLTATETKIMELLMKYPGRVFPAEEIYERVWNEQGMHAKIRSWYISGASVKKLNSIQKSRNT